MPHKNIGDANNIQNLEIYVVLMLLQVIKDIYWQFMLICILLCIRVEKKLRKFNIFVIMVKLSILKLLIWRVKIMELCLRCQLLNLAIKYKQLQYNLIITIQIKTIIKITATLRRNLLIKNKQNKQNRTNHNKK